MTDTDPFWDELLTFIKAGRVIPVVGDRAVTFGADDEIFSAYAASEIARRLTLDHRRLPPQPTLTDVACEWLVTGGRSSELYKTCYVVCEQFEKLKRSPGRALMALASIPTFRLFLTTTFDSLLWRALSGARPGSRPISLGFFPNKDPRDKDLPARCAKLSGTTIYHLFGQASLIEGEYVLWEEDVLDFICALHATISGGKDLDFLARDLADNALLIVGLNFTDLLVRLFLRVAKQRSLTSLSQKEILTEPVPGFGHRGNILFFGGVLKNVHVREQDPIDFALELRSRWDQANPKFESVAVGSAGVDIPHGAIFISYAREDEAIARSLSEALTLNGCVVWYDRERLKPGACWPDELKEAVERVCTVFVSLVSQTTETEESGYWRRERTWAIERAPDFYPDEFYIPIWIDHTQPPFRREPEAVRSRVNAVRLPAADTGEFKLFAERLRALQVRRSVSKP